MKFLKTIIIIQLFLLMMISSCAKQKKPEEKKPVEQTNITEPPKQQKAEEKVVINTNDMILAVEAIERARSVYADKYAANEFNSAIEFYNNSVKEYNKSNFNLANSNAIEAKIKADSAYNIALSNRAFEAYSEVNIAFKKAEDAGAAKFAKEEYNSFTNRFAKYKNDLDNKDYKTVINDKEELLAAAENLFNKANKNNKEYLKAKNIVNQVEDKYRESLNNKLIQEYGYDELIRAIPLIEQAKKSLENGDYEDAIKKAGEAQLLIDDAIRVARERYNQQMKEKAMQEEAERLKREQEKEKLRKQAEDYIKDAKDRLNKLKQLREKNNQNSKINLERINIAYELYNYTLLAQNDIEDFSDNNTNKDKVVVEPATKEYIKFDSEVNQSGKITTNSPNKEESVSQDISDEDLEFSDEGEYILTEETNTYKRVVFTDEDVSIELAEKYISFAERAFENEEYLEAIDYAREAIRVLDILIAMEDYKIYTVILNPKDRDCLWKIARKLYKNPFLWPVIWRANKYQIKDPDLIYPDQRLKIPPILN